VKLLDFGIAKLLDPPEIEDQPHTGDVGHRPPPRPREAEPQTRTMARVLTPEYARPEQVRGDRITTASDVYQLGVVLYELLSGHRPFAATDAGTTALERVLSHEEPPPPSTAATRPGGTASSLADGPTLRRRLRGDLDTIVLKALAREPELRYASVGELRDDPAPQQRRPSPGCSTA
jgi:eukaryotic-like serine/threonine-protein kinase